MSESPIHIYYWKATFEDGTEITQYDKFGNCVLTKNLCPKEIPFHKFCNPFEWFEAKHGRVLKIGWYPFEIHTAQLASQRNPGLKIAISEDIKPIEQIIPADHYAAPPRTVSAIQCQITQGKEGIKAVPGEKYVSQLTLVMVPRNDPEHPIENNFEVNYI